MKSIDVMSGTAGSSSSSSSSSSDLDQAHNQKSMSDSGGNCRSSTSSASCDPKEIYVGSFAYLQQQQQHEQHQRWMQQQLQYQYQQQQQQQQQDQQPQYHAAQQPQHPLVMTMAQNGQTSSATTLWLQQQHHMQQQQQQQQCRQRPFPPASMVPSFEAPSRSYSRSSSSSYSSSSDSTTDSYKYQHHHHQQQHHHQHQHQNEYRPFTHGYNKDMAIPRSAIRSGDRDNSTSNKRSVSFASMNEVYFNSTDLDEIVTTCWYSRDDLRQFKSERKMIVRMLKSVKFDPTKIDTSIYDLRGLEAYSSIAFNALMQKKRKQVFQAVLNEQGRQRQQQQQQLQRDGGGSTSNQPLPLSLDDESIRDVSSSASKWARERGLELGRADAMLVGNSPFESLNSTTTDDDDDSMVDASDEENDDNDDYESEMAVVEASAAAVVGGRAMPQRMKLLSRDSFSTSCSSESSGSFSLSGDGPDCSFSSSSSSSGSTWAEQLMGEALIPEEE
mmetsp:Transcript_18324/g.44237  ORF Transcript_18324/g.44237 Transcript_18324/m.44237 type:complete len:499 (-) Transcript_18324:93-1589(-)